MGGSKKCKSTKKIGTSSGLTARACSSGILPSVTGDEVTMTDVRRIWYWDGAASLSQLAVDGVSKPKNCKFTVCVDEMVILGVIEIIPCTEKAVESIKGVKPWKC